MNATRFAPILLGLCLAGAALPAAAATYQLTLKTDVATGFFDFDKSGGSGTATVTSFVYNDDDTIDDTILDSFDVTVQVQDIQLEKPGTDGQLECLDQGPNVVGVTRNSGGGTSDIIEADNGLAYKVDFTFSFVNGCPGLASFTRTYSVQHVDPDNGNPIGGPATGDYHIRNDATIPEPEMLLLFLTGAGALVAIRRRRQASRQTSG